MYHYLRMKFQGFTVGDMPRIGPLIGRNRAGIDLEFYFKRKYLRCNRWAYLASPPAIPAIAMSRGEGHLRWTEDPARRIRRRQEPIRQLAESPES